LFSFNLSASLVSKQSVCHYWNYGTDFEKVKMCVDGSLLTFVLFRFAEQMEFPVRLKNSNLSEPFKSSREHLYENVLLAKSLACSDANRFIDGTIFSSSDRQRILSFIFSSQCGLNLADLCSRRVFKQIVCLHDEYETKVLTQTWFGTCWNRMLCF
jgi:hypothetical protein